MYRSGSVLGVGQNVIVDLYSALDKIYCSRSVLDVEQDVP